MKSSSQSGFSEKPISETGFPETPITDTEFPENPMSETAIPETPTSEIVFPGEIHRPPDPVLTQDHVIEVLLNNRHDPKSALRYFHWAEQQRGFIPCVDSLCTMLQILLQSGKINCVCWLLKRKLSGSSSPSPTVLIDRLMEVSRRCISKTPYIFQVILNSYVWNERIEEAIESFNAMVKNDVFPSIMSRNILLAALVRLNMIPEARELYTVIRDRGMDCNCFTLNVIMHACLKEGKPEEAEEYFLEARSQGSELDAVTYSTAIQAVCKKPNSKGACELLKKMRELGWVPSEGIYMRVIDVCMKQGNMEEALRLKDEMIRSGISEFGGHNESDEGHLHQYAEEVCKEGFIPIYMTYNGIIDSFIKEGTMNSALSMYHQVSESGVSLNVVTFMSFINGSIDLALKIRNEIGKQGSLDVVVYNALMDGFCKKGNMDSAHKLFVELVEVGLALRDCWV
ncbi:pentatricopeptide repeat-containing protein At3g54980, mitochondrial-like [Magnolia sinica]|uniref:pentatricopeptide repeat-containing protein At3g54980, mitochondrial-like n=1 Tax=Magnolia sinica TaxID=86752 RepID=UPI002658CE00|nr:pentatricopeptide repeat-containing protein At3g54980, mitochondrial-like [Magnolia sinica]